MKKKVIFVVASMAGGGAERVIAILANGLVVKGIDVAIMMFAGSEVAYSLDSKVELVSIGGKTGGSMLARIERIKKMRMFFKQNKKATVIVFGLGASFYAVVADLFIKNPMIISERNDPAACKYPGLRNLIYSRADHIVYQTDMAKESFPQYLQKNSTVIANPISSKLPKRYNGERTNKIVAVGRLEEQKNYKLMLGAFSKVYKKYPNYKLHIFGKGYLEKELKELAKQLDISQGIVWEGFCKNVWNEIKDASMYLLASDFEGISNSMLEALGLGLPVIATDCPIGGSRMCISHRENGLLVPVGNLEALAEAMCEIIENKEFANRLSDNAYQIRVRFSEECIIKQWMNVVENL